MFGTKKKLKQLEVDLDIMREGVEHLRSELKQMQCSHSRADYKKYYAGNYYKGCLACGLVLETYKTEREMLVARQRDDAERLKEVGDES